MQEPSPTGHATAWPPTTATTNSSAVDRTPNLTRSYSPFSSALLGPGDGGLGYPGTAGEWDYTLQATLADCPLPWGFCPAVSTPAPAHAGSPLPLTPSGTIVLPPMPPSPATSTECSSGTASPGTPPTGDSYPPQQQIGAETCSVAPEHAQPTYLPTFDPSVPQVEWVQTAPRTGEVPHSYVSPVQMAPLSYMGGAEPCQSFPPGLVINAAGVPLIPNVPQYPVSPTQMMINTPTGVPPLALQNQYQGVQPFVGDPPQLLPALPALLLPWRLMPEFPSSPEWKTFQCGQFKSCWPLFKPLSELEITLPRISINSLEQFKQFHRCAIFLKDPSVSWPTMLQELVCLAYFCKVDNSSWGGDASQKKGQTGVLRKWYKKNEDEYHKNIITLGTNTLGTCVSAVMLFKKTPQLKNLGYVKVEDLRSIFLRVMEESGEDDDELEKSNTHLEPMLSPTGATASWIMGNGPTNPYSQHSNSSSAVADPHRPQLSVNSAASSPQHTGASVGAHIQQRPQQYTDGMQPSQQTPGVGGDQAQRNCVPQQQQQQPLLQLPVSTGVAYGSPFPRPPPLPIPQLWQAEQVNDRVGSFVPQPNAVPLAPGLEGGDQITQLCQTQAFLWQKLLLLDQPIQRSIVQALACSQKSPALCAFQCENRIPLATYSRRDFQCEKFNDCGPLHLTRDEVYKLPTVLVDTIDKFIISDKWIYKDDPTHYWINQLDLLKNRPFFCIGPNNDLWPNCGKKNKKDSTKGATEKGYQKRDGWRKYIITIPGCIVAVVCIFQEPKRAEHVLRQLPSAAKSSRKPNGRPQRRKKQAPPQQTP
ncbi:hypothetical protein Pelo_13108 [Pelomyxa schiedti]|nr:hypothetical protein Pelo_13108 [Pelomyxa schiedti]